MILVTVGTTMPFDELLMQVDRVAASDLITEPILCQSGHSTYRMKYGTQFVGRSTLADLIEESSLVITHGGSTVIQLLLAGKPFIAFPNPRGAGDHQTSFLLQVAELADISWSRDVNDLAGLIQQRRSLGAMSFSPTHPRIADQIRAMFIR